MEFNYALISPQELTKTEKIILACRGEDFCCIRLDGVVKINKALPKTVLKIAAAMWQCDQPLDCADTDMMDELWQDIKLLAGENAANQIYRAWREEVKANQEAEGKRIASEWLNGRSIQDELDAIADAYHPGVIKALWSKTVSTDAIFLYGYLTGMEKAKKATC